MRLNEEKTEFLVIGSVHSLRCLGNVTLNVGSTVIVPSKSARNLGAYFDCNLSMLEQVNHLCKTVRFHLKNISQIRKYIIQDICHSAVRCHILSRLDYCNCLLTSVPKAYLKRLQSLQNWAAHIIFKLDRCHDSSPLLKSLQSTFVCF